MSTLSPKGSPLYDVDLAHIHVDGYGFHWAGAADAILRWLDHLGISKDDYVVDLGCGGGQWLDRLAKNGYRKTCGIDVSESMIRIAKGNATEAKLLCGSFDEATIPTCVAVTSLGEPLNYLNSGPAMRRTIRNVFAALQSGGVFIFDVRHPAKSSVPVRHHHQASEDWFCYSRIEEDYRTNRMTRYITTFYLLEDGKYRRDEEIHKLKIFPQAEVAEWLRKIGFRVRTKRSYGGYKLGPRQSVFICRKPNS